MESKKPDESASFGAVARMLQSRSGGNQVKDENRPVYSRMTLVCLLLAVALYLFTEREDLGEKLGIGAVQWLKALTVIIALLPGAYYFTRIGTAPIVWQAMALAVALSLLGRLLHVSQKDPDSFIHLFLSRTDLDPHWILAVLRVGTTASLFGAVYLAIDHLLAARSRLEVEQERNREEIEHHLRTKAKLVERENHLEALTDATTAGIFLIQGERCSYCNGAARNLVGYTEGELRETDSFWDLIGVDRNKVLGGVHSRSGATDRNRSAREFEFAPRSGEPRWAEVSVTEFVLDRTDTLLLTVHDISRRKQAEENLQLSEERFRSLTQFIPGVSIQGYRTDGTVFFWNRASEEIYGYAASEAVGRKLGDLIIPPEHQDSFRRALTVGGKSMMSGEFMPADELNLRRKDGSSVPVYSIRTAVCLEGKEPSLYCIDVDLSEMKEAETERVSLERQLARSQKMEALGQLAGGVAHDFNNLLTAILLRSEFIESQVEDNPSLLEEVVEVKKAGKRGAALTRQLLLFSRHEASEMRDLDLNEIIKDLEKLLQRLLPENILLKTQLAYDIGFLRADAGQVEQVIVNLVVNARDAMPDGGVLRIGTSVDELSDSRSLEGLDLRTGTYAVLTVSDTGCGMDDETRERVFEPFFTTKQKGKGTGLGLSTIYGIVRHSKGHVSVHSELGVGTEFRVCFPQSDGTDVREDPGEDSVRRGDGTETILIIEDDKDIRIVASVILERRGYTVLEAGSGEEALEILHDHDGNVDLLVSDVMLPGMSGPQMVSEAIQEWPGLKVLFMSGYTEDSIVDYSELRKKSAFLDKPFDSKTIADKVRRVLDFEAAD